MQIRDDFSQHVVVRPEDHDWVQSPSNGVDRMMLDRIGGEVARATTIVRFAPGSRFAEHSHGGGEEFLVLEGVFSDETGDFPTGTYVRNPIGTAHSPHTDPGCTIFVKLHQFAPDDTRQFRVDTGLITFEPGKEKGIEEAVLHDVASELVRLVRFAPGTEGPQHFHIGGEEVLVLQGSFSDENGHYPKGTWVRNPHGSRHTPRSDDGCLLWIKTGHLPH